LHAIHNKMMNAVAEKGGRIDGVFFCPHTANTACSCRKPSPGLLRDISRRFGRPLNRTPMVGDSLRDLQAGATLECDLWLVKTGKGLKTMAAAKDPATALPAGTRVVDHLSAVVDHLLQEQQ
jgi:D-glycero-D-manno-heptose 1,7-bisphosphate phosphatase